MSKPFKVKNGVWKGRILSPVLIDELSIRLKNVNIGSHVNSRPLNHLLYADDSELLAPTHKHYKS